MGHLSHGTHLIDFLIYISKDRTLKGHFTPQKKESRYSYPLSYYFAIYYVAGVIICRSNERVSQQSLCRVLLRLCTFHAQCHG